MKKLILTLILLSVACLWVSASHSHNPFTAKPEYHHTAPRPPVKHPIFVKIVLWQQQMRQKMSDLVREVRAAESPKPLFFLLSLALIYGMVHAAGPGHGKLVALSYLVSCGRKYPKAILFGNLVAFFHGLSGVLFVLVFRMLLSRTVSGTLEETTRITQLISFGFIFLLGAFLLFRAVVSWKRGVPDDDREGDGTVFSVMENPFAVALAVGMIPCPGVVLVMLFCLSMGLVGLGVVLSFLIALGMAVTITGVVLFGLTGKKAATGLAGRRKMLSWIIERTIETVAAFVITILGCLLFISNL